MQRVIDILAKNKKVEVFTLETVWALNKNLLKSGGELYEKGLVYNVLKYFVGTEETLFPDDVLTWAVKNRVIDVVNYTVSDANMTVKRKNKALTQAAGLGDVELVDLLIKYGAEVSSEETHPYWRAPPLTAAIRNGHIGVVRFLVEKI